MTQANSLARGRVNCIRYIADQLGLDALHITMPITLMSGN
jgi:hypothetical protein